MSDKSRSLRERNDESVTVFASESAAVNYDREGNVTDGELLAREDLSRPLSPLKPSDPRFAVLSTVTDSERFFNVAFVADQFDEATIRESQQICREAKEKQLGVRDAIIKERTLRDVVFLVDATKSMGAYFAPVVQAIEDFVTDYESSADRQNWRFGVAVYRDKSEGSRAFERLNDLDSVTQVSASSLGAAEAYSSDADPDLEEGLWYGVESVLEPGTFSWREGSSRVIILIGDHPDKQSLSASGQERLRKLLTQQNTGTSFYAINVYARPDVTGDSLNERYRKQIGDLQTFAATRGGTSEAIALNRLVTIPRGTAPGQVGGDVLKAIRGFRAFSNSVLGATEILTETGDFSVATGRHGAVASRVAAELIAEKMAARGVECVRIGEIEEIVLSGYVNRFVRDQSSDTLTPQLRVEILMPMPDIWALTALMLRTSETVGGGQSNAGNVLGRVIESATGDRWDPNETLEEFFNRKYHIPLADDRTLISFTREELDDLLRNPTHKKALKEFFGEVAGLLKAVADGKAVTPDFRANNELYYDEAYQEFYPTEGLPKKTWAFSIGSNKNREFAWIPIEFFPWSLPRTVQGVQ